MFELVLVDPNEELCSELEKHFIGLEKVKVVNGKFQDIENWDCVISPGNSFGIMDGGFDLLLLKLFGKEIQRKVQANIFMYHAGLQPVGTSHIVELNNIKHPFVAYTPTMLHPMPINGTINVFLSMKAALQSIQIHNDNGGGKNKKFINKVICPGLGTATGRVPYSVAAYQMRLAYDLFFNTPKKMDWDLVRQIVKKMSGGQHA
ncbi:hypothetical protein [Paenibacillus yanchengensis]|uniref:Macro domain-containing protein n=1 Tax=Paenibacillus yanchengensis TaxID=2035833 RepID=A0ABW4YQZ7_9BACL